MSFASEVKKELTNVEANDCCQKAELYGIIRYKANLVILRNHFGVQVVTTMSFVARRIMSLFKKIYNVKSNLVAIQRQNLDYKIKYVLTFNEEEQEFLKDLGILNSDNTINEEFNRKIIKCDQCKGSLLRGLFICQGSINDPKSSNYHLEITIENKEDIPYLYKYLEEVGIKPKTIKREKGYVIYLKKAEQIGDFLKFVGAVTSLFKFEDIRIEKDYTNNFNRIMNCDIHNEQRALESAMRQLEEIKFITEKKGIVNLTPRLVDAIMLRTKYPESSLSDLSEVSEEEIGRKISKSGLNHCFKDIHELYKKLNGGNK